MVISGAKRQLRGQNCYAPSLIGDHSRTKWRATADLAIAFLPGIGGYLLGIVLWGMHMGMSQGLLATLIADHAPAELRGSAFGMFSLVCGGALLIGNVLAGVLWEFSGSDMTFLAGAAFCVLAGLAVLILPTGGAIAGRKRD